MTCILQNMMFIHIPKTGGHSVKAVMEENDGFSLKDVNGFGNGFSYHERSSWLRDKLGFEEYDRYNKVSLVRNPWERAVGLYFGENRPGGHSVRGFRKWVLAQSRIRYKSKDKRIDPLTPQSWMLTPEVIVFDLARIDELYQWMEINLDSIGPIVSPHVLSGKIVPRLPYREYYSSRVREMVTVANYQDIKKYGWKF